MNRISTPTLADQLVAVSAKIARKNEQNLEKRFSKVI